MPMNGGTISLSKETKRRIALLRGADFGTSEHDVIKKALDCLEANARVFGLGVTALDNARGSSAESAESKPDGSK